ncbi:MAG: hypothetical protein RLZZ499_1840, partial [Cyanobacteriota bacterium]
RVSLSVPLDEALGIAPHQSSSEELVRLGCLLSIVMPYELVLSGRNYPTIRGYLNDK